MKRRCLTPCLLSGVEARGGKRALWFVLCLLLMFSINITAQEDETYTDEDTASVITAPAYKENPAKYLSKIDSSKIPTGILIDRVKFRKDIADFNGKSRVKTCDYYIWKRLYNNCKFASNDSGHFHNAKEIRLKAVSMMTSESNMIPIGLINMEFNKINLNALTDGRITENDSNLNVKDLEYNLFKQKRLFAATTFSNQLYGDEINFFISPDFYITNDTSEITKIELDFGNGEGYKQFYWNKIQAIKFKESSGYTLVKIRFSYSVNDSSKTKTKKLISHFSFLRTGSDLIPEVKRKKNSKLKSGSTTVPNARVTYPINSTKDSWVLKKGVLNCSLCRVCNTTNEDCYNYDTEYTDETTSYNYVQDHTKWVRDTSGNYKIDASILWATGNTSGKLRNPILIPDAFDPGNSRDYYTDHIEYDSDPKKFDNRGLYQIIDGQPSAWYPTEQPAGTVNALLAAGYDLVFVNFANGAGDLEQTADTLIGFLNTVINSPTYRDEQTGELVLIGPSMAGLVSRIALTKMEQSGQEHYVKTWIAFDSPQEGAYIPITLQWGINYLHFRPQGTYGVSAEAMEMLRNKLAVLNTPGAKQMLIEHYSALGTETDASTWYGGGNLYGIEPISDYTNLHTRLDTLGYPKLTRNLAITNGGTSKLYETEGSQILKFNVRALGLDFGCEGYGNYNDGYTLHKFFKGFWADNSSGNDYSLYATHQIGYENAPGGWHGDLYVMNQNEDNGDYALDFTKGKIQYEKAIFMVTASAFGLKVTTDNVYKTWDKFSVNQTPFDDLLGMDGESQEHVKINEATKNKITTFLKSDKKILQRPRTHLNGTLSESISKNLALKSDSVALLGSSNGAAAYIIKSGAKVSVTAPYRIKLLPGTKCEKGATFKAKIQTSSGTKSAFSQNPPKGIDYSKLSPWNNMIYSYADNNVTTLVNKQTVQSEVTLYPNPTNGIVNIVYTGTESDNGSVRILNMFGQQVFYNQVQKDEQLDLSSLPNGIYTVKTEFGTKQQIQKLVKK